MEPMLILAIIMITLALVFYTWGVWAEHRKGRLEPKHLILFLIGLFFDTSGTVTMSVIAKGSEAVITGINWHAITGGLAIGLMLVHALWAAVVLKKKNEKSQKSFHKFSLFVWLLWLVPYLSGAIMAMSR